MLRLEIDFGAVALLAWSMIVPKIESVPSWLSKICSRRHRTGRGLLVGQVAGEALDRVVAEDDHQLARRLRGRQLSIQPLELRVVDVAVRRGPGDARVAGGVETDEAHPRDGAPGVIAGGAIGRGVLRRVDEVKAVTVGLGP